MNLIILTENDCVSKERYILKDNRLVHIREILKLSSGDKIDVGLLNGPVGQAVLEKSSDDEIILNILKLETQPVKTPVIDLICALPRPQTLKKVLFSAAMMNIRQVHLIRANRVEKSYYQSPLLEKDNYKRFLLDGLQQGKNTMMPEVHIHNKFRPFFEDRLCELENKLNFNNSIKLLPDQQAEDSIKDIIDELSAHLFIAIGPEGGWVPFEIELMEKAGFKRCSLGSWTLRVEHALTAVLAQVELIKTL